jgi:hypothetical protein
MKVKFDSFADKALLLRYLKLYTYRLNKAQVMLSRHIDLRARHPWFFTNRDPNAAEMQKIINTL